MSLSRNRSITMNSIAVAPENAKTPPRVPRRSEHQAARDLDESQRAMAAANEFATLGVGVNKGTQICVPHDASRGRRRPTAARRCSQAARARALGGRCGASQRRVPWGIPAAAPQLSQRWQDLGLTALDQDAEGAGDLDFGYPKAAPATGVKQFAERRRGVCDKLLFDDRQDVGGVLG